MTREESARRAARIRWGRQSPQERSAQSSRANVTKAILAQLGRDRRPSTSPYCYEHAMPRGAR